MKTIITRAAFFMFIFIIWLYQGMVDFQGGSVFGQVVTKSAQTTTKVTPSKTKSVQTTSKPSQGKSGTSQKSAKPEPVKKVKEAGTVTIGSQTWALANLNTGIFSNGDTIPEAKTFQEWAAAGQAGKPACCYYNNDPVNGPRYGRLYNWYAINDPRGLAPKGWSIPSDNDWALLVHNSGGSAEAGSKMKAVTGWSEGYNGTNETGFTGLPAGYRIENGAFLNQGSMAIWWSTTEIKSNTAVDHYLSMASSLGRSINPKQRGESVRCLKK